MTLGAWDGFCHAMKISRPDRTGSSSALLFGVALAALYAVIMTAKFALWRENVLMNDWAFYNNSFWNTNFHDLWLFSHDRLILYGYPSYLNEHFGPLLFVLAALYHLMPRGEIMLLLIHGASPVLAALGIRALAVHLLGDRKWATVIALAFALNPGILWPTISMVYGFQPDSMLPPLAALAGWALATRRDGYFFLALVLALGIKENVPAYGLILGVCLLIFTDRRKLALSTIVVSLAVFVIASKGVPALTGVENRNVGAVWRFLDQLIHLRPSFDYTLPEIVVGLGYSAAFLPCVFVWPFMAMIGPDLLLIGQVPQANTVSWHIMLPVTVLALGAVWGTARILITKCWPAWLDARLPREQLMRRYWMAVLAASVIAGPLTVYLAYDRYAALRSPIDQAAVAQALALIPGDAGVATTTDLEQYFVRRRVVTANAYVLQHAAADFSYLVVNRNGFTPGRLGGKLADALRQDRCFVEAAEQLARDGGKIVIDRGGILAVGFSKLPTPLCQSGAGVSRSTM